MLLRGGVIVIVGALQPRWRRASPQTYKFSPEW
jgi:hypothetical protein